MGKHSKHLKVIEEMVSDLVAEEPDLSPEEAIELACTIKNERHIERGYSPTQWFLGSQENPADRLLEGNTGSISAILSGPEVFK